MSTLIVYCHPYEQSFCHAMLDALCERYDREGTPYQVIDLHADGFDPVLSRTSSRSTARAQHSIRS